MIPKEFIEMVLLKTNIAALVGGYVELTERGRDLIGLCPFDGGNRATFTVSTDKQVWKCFKCGKGGNAVRFIIEIEKLSFPDAIGLLAKRLDLQVPEE